MKNYTFFTECQRLDIVYNFVKMKSQLTFVRDFTDYSNLYIEFEDTLRFKYPRILLYYKYKKILKVQHLLLHNYDFNPIYISKRCPKCNSKAKKIKYKCFRCNEILSTCKNCIGFRFCPKEGNCI